MTKINLIKTSFTAYFYRFYSMFNCGNIDNFTLHLEKLLKIEINDLIQVSTR